MLWFEGSVAEAVNLSKQRNAIFVVFVEGENDLSSEMARTLEDGDITRRLVEQTNFLTIKLKSGSTDYVHFAQIYQFVPVPSLFFIGRNGTPLEVVCAGIQAASLATRIDRILEEHHKQSPSVSSAAVASGSKDNVKQTTADLIKSEASTSEASASAPAPSTAAAAPTPPPSGDPKPQYEVVCDGDVCVRRPLDRDEAGPSQPANPPPNLTPVLQPSAESIALVNQQEQAKMERAKLLIEARKREKAELEKQQEIQKELERRQVGQGVAELKKWQQDQEMKQIQEERRREKKENDMARQRVLDQIAQDRAERRARDLPPAPAPAPVTPVTPTAPLDLGNKARIQFKMPDGSSAAAQFDAGDTLATVRRHVADNLHLTSSSFTLWTAFPRLELRDDSATLTQLKLAPSAALLVLPSSAVAKPNTSSRIVTFLKAKYKNIFPSPFKNRRRITQMAIDRASKEPNRPYTNWREDLWSRYNRCAVFDIDLDSNQPSWHSFLRQHAAKSNDSFTTIAAETLRGGQSEVTDIYEQAFEYCRLVKLARQMEKGVRK